MLTGLHKYLMFQNENFDTALGTAARNYYTSIIYRYHFMNGTATTNKNLHCLPVPKVRTRYNNHLGLRACDGTMTKNSVALLTSHRKLMDKLCLNIGANKLVHCSRATCESRLKRALGMPVCRM